VIPVLSRLRLRAEELRDERNRQIADRLAAAQRAARGDVDTVLAGDRVLDTVTGQTGVVIATRTENVIVQDS
jgi:electron transfer flavoprotein alpha/beta subunit